MGQAREERGAYKDFNRWPTRKECSGSGLRAVAYRQDELPDSVFPPMPFTLKAPSRYEQQLIAILRNTSAPKCDIAALKQQLAVNPANEQHLQFNTTENSTWASYAVFGQQLQALMNSSNAGVKEMQGWPAPNLAALNMTAAYGDQVYEQDSEFQALTAKLPNDTSSMSEYLWSESDCAWLNVELRNPTLNMTLTPIDHEQLECSGSLLYVIVYNCFEREDMGSSEPSTPDMMVHAQLGTSKNLLSLDTACITAGTKAVYYINLSALVTVGFCAALVFILFEGPAMWKHIAPNCSR